MFLGGKWISDYQYVKKKSYHGGDCLQKEGRKNVMTMMHKMVHFLHDASTRKFMGIPLK